MIHIEPLSLATIDETCALANSVFEGEDELPEVALRDSIGNDGYTGSLAVSPVTVLDYWVAVDEGSVIGVIGLYELEVDQEEATWVGWFCVAKERRSEGVGDKLFHYILEEARTRGKRVLRLYTNHSSALRFYEERGFKSVTLDAVQGQNDDTVVMEKVIS